MGSTKSETVGKKADKTAIKASCTDVKSKREESCVLSEKEARILNVLLKEYKFGNTNGINHNDLAKKCQSNKTSQWFVDTIKMLRDEKKFILKQAGGYILAESGAKAMGYEKQDLSLLATDDELHEHIKNQLDPKLKGPEILEKLYENCPMTRQELAKSMNIHDRSHSFSYGLKRNQRTRVCGGCKWKEIGFDQARLRESSAFRCRIIWDRDPTMDDTAVDYIYS